MKRILILIKDYFKLSSPNAICIHGVINEWNNNNYEVDIISAENNECISDEHNIYISKPDIRLHKILKFFAYPLDSEKLVKLYEKAIENCIVKKNYDLVIAVVNPIESIQALYNVKKRYPNLKTCLYEIDPISNRYKTPKNFLEKYLSNRAINWSCKIYSDIDYIIHMVTHKKHFEKDIFSRFDKKSFYLDIPALRVIFEKESADILENLSIVYAGAFYKDIRNPKKIIDVLKLLCEKYNFRISIYTNKAMIEDIKNMTKNVNSNFYVSNYIPEKELNNILLSTSYLLSVGNKNSDFLPSKIFLYFGMNKPIIHYAFDNNDVALPYLKKYKNSLCISDQDSVETIAEAIENFILEKRPIIYSKEELKSIFIENTPEYNARKIIEYCEI